MQPQPVPPASPLAKELKRSRFPRDRELAFLVGLEFMRAAADGREPATWAKRALEPRIRPRSFTHTPFLFTELA